MYEIGHKAFFLRMNNYAKDDEHFSSPSQMKRTNSSNHSDQQRIYNNNKDVKLNQFPPKDDTILSTSSAPKSSGELITIGATVSVWFMLSISISNINKWIFTEHKFQYPIFLTAFQMLIAFTTNFFLLNFTPLRCFRSSISAGTWRQIVHLSLVFCAAIALGNIGLKYLYVSFAKMIMATTPAVTVFLSRAISGAQFSQSTYTSLIPLCCGTILCAFGEGRSFHMVGFICTALSAVLSGLKSIFQAVILKEDNISSIMLLYHISLPSFFFLSIAVLTFERDLFHDMSFLRNQSLMLAILASCLSGILYNITTFMVTRFTSPITIRVLGNANILLNVAISVILFNHTLSTLSVLGVTATLIGIILYQRASKQKIS